MSFQGTFLKAGIDINALNELAALSNTELDVIDGVTAGTVTASKAVVVDSSKDIGTFNDITARAGELGGVYGSVGPSSTVTNTTTPTDFDTTVTIPANTLKAGDTVRVMAVANVASSNSTDTLTVAWSLGGETIGTTGAVDVADDNVCYIDAALTFPSVGAAVNPVGISRYSDLEASTSTTETVGAFVLNNTIDTTAAIVIKGTATWSVAHADNQAALQSLVVFIN